MAFFGKTKNGERSVNLIMFDGIDAIPRGMAVSVTLFPDQIEIRQIVGGKARAYLSYDQVVKVGCVNEKEVKEADKSVIGRAVVGGVLLGPLGAIIGGVSGVGKKQKTKYKNYFVINYTAAGSDEPKVLSFEVGGPLGFKAFIDELKEKSGIADSPAVRSDTPTIL